MISGRYRCEKLRRHWSQNTDGYCELEPCFSNNTIGSLEHMLLFCEGLYEPRSAVLSLWRRKLEPYPSLKLIFQNLTKETSVQFLLDPSATQDVISLMQKKDNDSLNLIFHLSRTYCASLHRYKMKLLGYI